MGLDGSEFQRRFDEVVRQEVQPRPSWQLHLPAYTLGVGGWG